MRLERSDSDIALYKESNDSNVLLNRVHRRHVTRVSNGFAAQRDGNELASFLHERLQVLHCFETRVFELAKSLA